MALTKLEQTKLDTFEQRFRDEIDAHAPKIMADILVSRDEVDELGELLGKLIRTGRRDRMRVEYPLCTSLFLVWCTVYHYKEGNLWDPIFTRLNIEPDTRHSQFLGQLFLRTLSRYNFQLPPVDRGKRFMTPILMHGYISDYYAGEFLNYLNAIYTSLSYDVSDEALDDVWSSFFSIDDEHLHFRETINQLLAQEQELERALSELGVPSSLKDQALETVDELKTQMDQEKEKIGAYEEALSRKLMEFEEIKMLFKEFRDCEVAMASLDEFLRDHAEDDSIGVLSNEVVSAFEGELARLNSIKNELLRSLQTSRNRLAVTRDKRAQIMTEIMKLGEGSYERGHNTLAEYRQLKSRRDTVMKQRKQLEEFVTKNLDLGNASIRQILTTSLTSLALANPMVFQDFVKSTIRMLDRACSMKRIEADHRMVEPIRKWYRNRGMNPRIRTALSQDAFRIVVDKGVSSEETSPPANRTKAKTALRISRQRLKRPILVFNKETRQITLRLPEQELNVQVRDVPKVEYVIDYGSQEEHRTAAPNHMNTGKIQVTSLDIPLTSPDLRGVSFRWINLFEYWPITLDEVLIFDHNGKLITSNQPLSNGFYYVAASSRWETDSSLVVDRYSCNVDGYSVYEVQIIEDRIRFATAEGDEIVISASRFLGISLRDLRWIPGMTQDGLPVATGSPRMVINKVFLEEVDHIIIELYHNGGLLHHHSLKEMVKQFGREYTSETVVVDIESLIGGTWRKPKWQTFEISVKDGQDYSLFTHAFCLVQQLSIHYEGNRVRIKVPTGSVLQHPEAVREGSEYVIPIHSESELDVRVYFARVGWKEFKLRVPSGKVEIVASDDEIQDTPYVILASQTSCLESLRVRFQADPELVRRINVGDSLKRLNMEFTVSKERVEVPLKYFADLFDGLEERAAIELRWTGVSGSGDVVRLVDVFPRVEVSETEIFQSELDDEYVLELSLKTDFLRLDTLRFRLWSDNAAEPLFDRRVRSNPDYFYIRKDALTSFKVNVELYYVEESISVFGTERLENICWSAVLKLTNRKAILNRVMNEGIRIRSFKYNGHRYQLPKEFPIVDISMVSQRFEGEELLIGYIEQSNERQMVLFYLDTENNTIPYLWDADYDGVQYDPHEGRLFWEIHPGSHVMGPLDELEFVLMEDDEQ